MSKSIGNVVAPEDIREGRSVKVFILIVHGSLCQVFFAFLIINRSVFLSCFYFQELLEKVHSSHKEGVIASNELKNAIRNQLKMFPDGIPQCGTDALRFSLLSHPINGLIIFMW